jgi:hypothetical protein
MSGEHAMEGGKNPGLPIDQRAVTVKGKDFKAREVEHGPVLAFSLSLIAQGKLQKAHCQPALNPVY